MIKQINIVLLLTISLGVFIGTSASTLMFTQDVELAQPDYYPDTCVGYPKHRPDLEWKVQKLTKDRVVFENGVSVYREAAIIMGDC